MLTQLHVLVIRHNKNDVGSDVSPVTLYPPTQTLTAGGKAIADQWGGQGHYPGQAHQLHDGIANRGTQTLRRLES